MIDEYLRRTTLANYDVRFLFKAGDRVLLKQKRPGKLRVRALGPYIFVSYTGELRVTAIIQDGGGKQQTVSVANLLPIHAGAAVAVRDVPVTGAAEAEGSMDTNSALRSELSDDSDFGAAGPGLAARKEPSPSPSGAASSGDAAVKRGTAK